MQQSISRRRILAVMVAILGLLGGSCWQPGSVTAQASAAFANAPYDQLAGIEYAVHRFYQTRTNIFLDAQVARFDTAENAALGLDALNAFYLDASTTLNPPMVFEPVDAPVIGTTSYAFNAAISNTPAGEKNGEATLVQVHDDVFVYTVFAVNPYFDFNFVEVTFDAAIAMVEAMAASPDAIATPSVTDDGPPSSAWAKLPDQEAEVPARLDVYSTEDTVNFAVEPIPTSIISTYGEVEGLETVVARSYGLLNSASGAPEDVPTAVVELAAFDEAANAEPAFATAATAQLVALGLEDAGLAEAEAGIPADEAIAYTLDVEFEGEQYSVAVIVARSGPYVVTVSAVTSGDDALAFARELSRAVIEANAGTGEGSHSGVGMSTGGIWDKLPTTGDEVLDGLESLVDDQYYPKLGGGF